jgi:predicted ATPase/DNA-binding SARP family transcriptional activator
MLGPLQIMSGGVMITGLESNKVRALLVYLFAEADRPHPREALMGLLWPELPDAAARHNLRQALTNLRQTLGDRTAQTPLLLIDREMIRLNPAGDYEVDVAAFTGLLAACDSHTHRRLETCAACMRRMEQAAERYRGGFLEGFFLSDSVAFEEWVLLTRERLHRLALHALGHLAAYHERRGAYEAAYRYASRQVELEPWREEAHRQAMRALFLSGQRSAALAQYERCRAVLEAELGVEPEQETTALKLSIENEELRTEDTHLTPSQCSMLNAQLPAQPTLFVGRETELAELADLLANPACRMLTIVGPGGIGKTRLALQAAAEQVHAFTDGVAFAPLAPLGSAEFLLSAIADALALTFQGPKDPKEQLLAYLREKELLLVLDNFEHLLDGAGLLAEIIRRAPTVTLLITSRARLGLRAEWLFDLTGLSCPPAESTSPIETYSAARLFLQSGQRARRQFAPVEDEARAVARICRLVEGLPLAIELTAAAVRAQSCVAIATALETAMQVPEAPWRDVPERHRSMRAVFDHSWRLLSDQERGVLQKLSVFRGGFEHEAAEQVAGAALSLLGALIDKSLLRRSATGRYDMHELVRQYAGEQLQEQGQVERTQDRHLSYYLALAEAAELELYGPQEVMQLEVLEREHNNLRAALGWAVEQQSSESTLRLGGTLWRFWEVHGHLGEGRDWLERALATGSIAPAAMRAKALNGAGRLAWRQCDYVQAQFCFETSQSLFHQIGDRRGVATALNNRGIVAMEQGDYANGQTLYEASLALRRELGDRRGVAASLINLGIMAQRQGDDTRAQVLYEESLALFQALGDKTGIAITLGGLGSVLGKQGDNLRAHACFVEGLKLFHELGSKARIAECLDNAAQMAVIWKQPQRVARLLGAAASLREAAGEHMDSYHDAEHARIVDAARMQLGDATFAAAWTAGRALTLDEAIAEALGPLKR